MATCVLTVFLGIFMLLVLVSGVASYEIGSSDGMEVTISEPVSGSSSRLVTDVAPAEVPTEWAVPGAECTFTIHLDTSEPNILRKRTVVNLTGEPGYVFADTGERSMELRYRYDSFDLPVKVTFDSVFWGWQGSDGNAYAPGEALPDRSGDLTLEAVWMKPNLVVAEDNFAVVMDGVPKDLLMDVRDRYAMTGSEPVPSQATAFGTSGGVSVLAFADGYAPAGPLSGGMPYTDPLLVTSLGAWDGTGGRASLPIGSLNLSGDTRFQDIGLTQAGDGGIFACGQVLVMGTGITGSGLNVFGGSPGGPLSGDTKVIVNSGGYSSIVGGSPGGSVSGTSQVTVGPCEVTDTVIGGSTGASGSIGGTRVSVSGCRMPDGSAVVGGSDSGTVTGASTVRVVGDSDVFQVFAGGRDSSSSAASSTAEVSGNAAVRGAVYGAPAVRGQTDNPVAAGDVTIAIGGSAEVGTVYGGGRGDWQNPAVSAGGNITITVDGGLVAGIFGGGSGLDVGTPGSRAGRISVEVLSGRVSGDVVGGGSSASVHASAISVWIGDAEVGGDVVGGGSGSGSLTDADRTVVVNGAAVTGSVYGGSISGTDGTEAANRMSTVAAVSGTVGGDVCGGGRGMSHLDSTVLLGMQAVKLMPAGPEAPRTGPLSIGSLYPGNHVGIPDGTDPQFLGSSVIRIGERDMSGGVQDKSSGTCQVTVRGAIGGIRDTDPSRSTSIYLDGCYNSQSDPIRSIQHAGYLEITNSDVFFGGAPRTGGGPATQVAVADIGHLVFGGYTKVHLMADTSSVDAYSSMYDGRLQIKENTAQKMRNEVCVYNGRMFAVLGPDDSGAGSVGTISGYTLLTRVSADGYYGAYALALDTSTGGFTMNNGKSLANVLDPADGPVKTWFISGHVSREYTATFPADAADMSLELRMYSLSGGASSYVYNGCRTEPSSKDSLLAVSGTDGISGKGVYLGVTLGTVGSCGDILFGGGNVSAVSHEYSGGSWRPALSPAGTGTLGTGSLLGVGLDLLSEDIYTGMVGTLSFSFTEVTAVGDKTLPINMLDYRIDLVMEPRGAPAGETDLYVSAAGSLVSGSLYSASAVLILPSLGGGYDYTLESDGLVPGIVSMEVRNDLGWVNPQYAGGPLSVSGDSKTEALLGTSGDTPVSLVLSVTFDTESDKLVQTFGITAVSGGDSTVYRVNLDLLSEVDMFFVCESRSDPDNPGHAAENTGVYMYVHAEGRGTDADPYILSWRDYTPGMSYDPGADVKPFRFQFGSVPGDRLFTIRYDRYSAPSETTLDSALSSMVSRLNTEEGLPTQQFSYSDNYMGVYEDPDMAVTHNFSSEVKGDSVLFAGFGLKVVFKAEGLSLLVPSVMLKPGESLSDKGLANIQTQMAGPGDYIGICAGYDRPGYGIKPVPVSEGSDTTVLSWVDERKTGVAYDFDAPCTRSVTLVVPWDPFDYKVRIVFDGVQPEKKFIGLSQVSPVKSKYTLNDSDTYAAEFDGLYALDLGRWYTGVFVSADPGIQTDGSDDGRLLFGIGLSGGSPLPEGNVFTITVRLTEQLDLTVELSGADRGRFCDDPAAGVSITVNGVSMVPGTAATVTGTEGQAEGSIRLEISIAGNAAFALWNSAGPVSQERHETSHTFDLSRSQCDGLIVTVYNKISLTMERSTTLAGNKAIPYTQQLNEKLGYNVTPIDLEGRPLAVMPSAGHCYNGYVVNICKTASGVADIRVAFPTNVDGVSKIYITDRSGVSNPNGDYGKYTLDGTSQNVGILLYRASGNATVSVTFQLGAGIVPLDFLNGTFFVRYAEDHDLFMKVTMEDGQASEYRFGKTEFGSGNIAMDASGTVSFSVPSPRLNPVASASVRMTGFDVTDTSTKNSFSFVLVPTEYSLYFNGSSSDPDTWNVTEASYVMGKDRQTSKAVVVDGKPLWTCYSGTLTGLFSGFPDPLMFDNDPASPQYRQAHLEEYVQIRDVGLDPSAVRVVFPASMFKNGDVLIRSPGLFEDNSEFTSPGSKPVKFDVRSGNLVIPNEYRGFGSMVLLDPVHGNILELVVISGISDIDEGSFIITLDSPSPHAASAFQGSTELNQTV